MSRHLRPVDTKSGPTADATAEAPPVPTPQAPARRSIRTRMVGLQGYALVAIAVILVVAALRAASGFFVPVAFSIVIALALAPLVRRVERLMPRWMAAALVVIAAVASLGAISYSLSDEAAQAVAGLPDATRVLRQSLRSVVDQKGGPLGQLQRAAAELQRTATENADRPTTPSGVTAVQVVAPPVDFSNFVWFGSQGVMAFLGSVALVAFLVYFLLASGDLFKRKFVKLSGERLSQRKVTVQMLDQIGARVAKAILHLAFAGLLVGVCTWAMLTWFGVRYAVLWGIAAGLLNCVPYLGPAVVAAGLFLAALLQFGEIATAMLIAAVSLGITTIEGSLFTPVVFGRSVALNPVAVFVSFMFWGWLWGIPGMFLALPLLTIVKTVAEAVDDLGLLAELLAD
jgi:predicted PurR-regulated permease PerM